jgi:hypothetical protein
VGYDDDPVLGTAVTFPAVHAFGDTRRHIVKYGAVATTRYMEYFAQRGAVTLNGNVAVTLSEAGIVDGTDTVTTLPTAQKDKATTYVRGTDYAVDYQKGTIARLPGSNIASGQTVEVAIVPPPVSRSTDTPTVLDLPSTTRPAVPKVAWIVPTFGWQTSSTGRRIRLGGGLRVFLERPWYSSGVGEQLAVVCGPVDTNNADLVHLVTQMGADPTFTTASPNQFPATADFPYAVSQPSGLLLSELSGEAVSAAGHNVDYDTDRQRWSCDVLLSPGASYQPFIRLVLGRYQPNSVTTDVALSPLAIAQWAQLGPNRSAAVTANTTDHAKVSVSVLGPAASEVNVMSVIVQTAPHGRDGDLDWTVVGPAAGQVLASGPFGQNDTVWSGNIELPTPRYAARYRLVLQEMEQHGSGGRLVYSDVLPVPGS